MKVLYVVNFEPCIVGGKIVIQRRTKRTLSYNDFELLLWLTEMKELIEVKELSGLKKLLEWSDFGDELLTGVEWLWCIWRVSSDPGGSCCKLYHNILPTTRPEKTILEKMSKTIILK